MSERLRRALYPGSVAVVGASQDATKRGHQVLRALRAGGYRGKVVPVNPKGGEILGLSAVRTIEEAPVVPDLAVICTPGSGSPALVEACGRRGVAGAVVLAAGFRETGAEGSALEDELRAAARETGIRLMGPNTSGFMNLGLGLDLIGIPGARRGRLALLVQSGNALLDLMHEAAAGPGEGFAVAVGVGNEAEVGFHEYLDVLGRDPGVGAILIHAESFRDGGAFLEVARRVARTTPIVALKGGRTAAGERAARSHTGAVATDRLVVRSAFRQAGIIEVTRADDLLPVGRALERQPAAAADAGLAILTDGGGHGTLAADTLEELGVPLADPAPATRDRLRQILGPNAALDNPVDLAGAGDRDPGVFSRAAEALLDDPGVAGILVVSLFGGYHLRFARELEEAEVRAAEGLVRAARAGGRPLVLHSIYAEAGSAPLDVLREGGIPVFRSVERACRAAAALRERGRFLAHPDGKAGSGDLPGRSNTGPARSEAAPLRSDAAPPRSDAAPPRSGDAAPGRILDEARRRGRTLLLETEARELLASHGVPFVPARLCRSDAEVRAAVRDLGAPVAVKAVSGTVTHKTDTDGVALGVGSAREAVRAARRIRASVEAWAEERGLDPAWEGVLVSPMLPGPEVELLVGARRDPTFGPVLTLGAGGTAVEVHRDVAVRVLPLGPGDVDEMVDQLRIAPLVRGGFRGRPGVDRKALDALLLGVAGCLLEHPEVEEVELNPVFAGPDGVTAVDARAFLRSDGVAGSDGDTGPGGGAGAGEDGGTDADAGGDQRAGAAAAPLRRESATPTHEPSEGSRSMA